MGGQRDFASALETDANRSARNSTDIITISVGRVIKNFNDKRSYFVTEFFKFRHLLKMEQDGGLRVGWGGPE